MQEKEGYVMNPKVKFSLMSFFSLAGFVGYIILLCNVKRIYAAGTAIGGFWVGLIACVILFDVLLHFAVRTGLEAFSGVVLLASHDHEMLTSTCNRVIAFQPDGTIIDRYGTYDDYLQWMAENKA